MKKILVATVKPFATQAVEAIKEIFAKAGYELTILESYKDNEQFLSAVEDTEAIIIRSDKVTSQVLDRAKNLKIVVRAGAGFDNVDTAYAKEKGVVVMNTPGQNSNAVAELAFGMMTYIARNKFNGKSGTELRGKTVGIHAFGNVGKFVAQIAKGFGMNVIAYDPYVDSKVMTDNGVTPISTVEELYEKSDYLSLHLPKIKVTLGFVNYSLMSKMKKGATLVNTARKEVVHEADLLKIFAERDDLKYLSDIAPDCKAELMEKYPNRCFFTPKKMGAQTIEANINAGAAAANQIVNYLENGDTTFQVNK